METGLPGLPDATAIESSPAGAPIHCAVWTETPSSGSRRLRLRTLDAAAPSSDRATHCRFSVCHSSSKTVRPSPWSCGDVGSTCSSCTCHRLTNTRGQSCANPLPHRRQPGGLPTSSPSTRMMPRPFSIWSVGTRSALFPQPRRRVDVLGIGPKAHRRSDCHRAGASKSQECQTSNGVFDLAMCMAASRSVLMTPVTKRPVPDQPTLGRARTEPPVCLACTVADASRPGLPSTCRGPSVTTAVQLRPDGWPIWHQLRPAIRGCEGEPGPAHIRRKTRLNPARALLGFCAASAPPRPAPGPR